MGIINKTTIVLRTSCCTYSVKAGDLKTLVYFRVHLTAVKIRTERLNVPRLINGVGHPGSWLGSFWILVTEGLRLMCQGIWLVLCVLQEYVYQTNSVLGLWLVKSDVLKIGPMELESRSTSGDDLICMVVLLLSCC